MVGDCHGVRAMSEYSPGWILIVTGSNLRAERMDRPLAYYLQLQIDRLGLGHEHRRAVVISDRYYLCRPQLRNLPTISVGGPGVNQVAQDFLTKLRAVLAVDDGFYIQMDPTFRDHRASVWGLDHDSTKIAVSTFADRYLHRFAQSCWERCS